MNHYNFKKSNYFLLLNVIFFVQISFGQINQFPPPPPPLNCVTACTWTGTSWSPQAPTINEVAIFAGNYLQTGVLTNVTACSVKVNDGITVTFRSDEVLTCLNDVIVGTLTTNQNAKLIFNEGASLVQINNFYPNFGNIIYNRVTNLMNR